MTRHIAVLARGVLVQRGMILLAAPVEEARAFLPGGHVEFGESAVTSLARELGEELGTEVTVGSFLGAVEHTFTTADGRQHAEVNLLFHMASGQLSPDAVPVSRERHIAFFWQPLTDLAAVRLEPHPLRQLLPQWLAEGREGNWSSTLR